MVVKNYYKLGKLKFCTNILIGHVKMYAKNQYSDISSLSKISWMLLVSKQKDCPLWPNGTYWRFVLHE